MGRSVAIIEVGAGGIGEGLGWAAVDAQHRLGLVASDSSNGTSWDASPVAFADEPGAEAVG